MRAMRLRQPGPVASHPLEAADLPVPEPGPGEIRLRVRACGVCHTDLHVAEGDLPPHRLPVVPGHQVVGVVEASGPGADRFRRGDRVGVGWLFRSCGACRLCLEGAENLCPQALFTGYDVDGGYADFAVAPEAFAFPLPAHLSDAEAAPLLCAGIIGYRALRLAETRPASRLGLFGFGASAHLAIQVVRHWDCEVYVFTRGEEHRHLARQLGAAWTGAAGDTPPVPLDSAVIFAPAGQLIPVALRVLRRGGTLAINAVHLDGIPALDYGLLYWERTVRSVANFTRRDAEEFLALAASIPIRTEVEVFPLAAAQTALERLKARQIRGAAVLVP